MIFKRSDSKLEFHFQNHIKVLFHEKTEYQDIKIMQTGQFGNMLLLDDDPNLADSDKPYTEVSRIIKAMSKVDGH